MLKSNGAILPFFDFWTHKKNETHYIVHIGSVHALSFPQNSQTRSKSYY